VVERSTKKMQDWSLQEVSNTRSFTIDKQMGIDAMIACGDGTKKIAFELQTVGMNVGRRDKTNR